MDPKNRAKAEALGISGQPITPELAAKWGTLMSFGQRRGQSKPPGPEGQPGPTNPANRLKNEKDGTAATDGNQVEEKKKSKHVTIREATEEDYRKLQHWNVGTFYRATQFDVKENKAMFTIGPKARGRKATNSIPEASADDPIYTRGFAIGEMRSGPPTKAATGKVSKKANHPPDSRGPSQNLKSGSGKVKRNKDGNRKQD